MDFNEPNTKNPPILDLPFHILSIIISFLPTKSIICCKLVCKLWCSIIKSPHFNLPSDRVTLLVRLDGDGDGLRNKDLCLVEPEFDFFMRRLRCQNYVVSQCLGKLAVTRFNGCEFDGVPVRLLDVVNSCNGLVCLASRSKKQVWGLPKKKLAIGSGPFFVCNPLTSDYVAVEQPIGTDDEFCLMQHCGFGYSAQSNQFKVLRLKSRFSDNSPLVAEVFTLGCDEGWRSIENPPQDYKWGKDRLFFRGSLHWIASHGSKLDYLEVNIVAFEFEEEKFSLVSPPILTNNFLDTKQMHLAILHQRLCFAGSGFDEEMDRDQCDIWVMSVYGDGKSWTKFYVVEDREYELPGLMIQILPPKPLAYLSTGELLMLSPIGDLISYDVRIRKMTVVEIPGCTSIEAIFFNPNFAPTRNLITSLKEKPLNFNKWWQTRECNKQDVEVHSAAHESWCLIV